MASTTKYQRLLPVAEPEPSAFKEQQRQEFDLGSDASISACPSLSSWVSPALVRDAIVGLSDGLTVPFALTAGLSALGDPRLVIAAGLAELLAGSLSMGLGGYLGAKSEAEATAPSPSSPQALPTLCPSPTIHTVQTILNAHHLPQPTIQSVLHQLQHQHENQLQHELPPTLTSPPIPLHAALTLGLAYFLGGLVPLLPYLVCSTVGRARAWSVPVMLLALFAFGWIRVGVTERAAGVAQEDEKGEGRRKGWWWKSRLRAGLEMVVVGGVAAGASAGCVLLSSAATGGLGLRAGVSEG